MSRLATWGVAAAMLCLALAAFHVQADLPIHCLHAQIAGDWTFSLDAGGHSPRTNGELAPVACGYPQPDRNRDHFENPPLLKKASEYKLHLSSPNIVTDDEGNKGTWSMVYDEGFEVRINGKVFFAFSKYVPNKGTSLSSDKVAHYTSHCDETMVGWYHDEDGSNWGCYKGVQTKALNAWTKPVTKVHDDGVDLAPVVSPTALLEEFTRVMRRDSEEDPRQNQELTTEEEESAFLETDLSVTAQDALTAAATATELPELDDSILFEPDTTFIERHNRNKRATWKAGSHKQFEKKPVSEMLRMLGLRQYAKGSKTSNKALHQPIKDTRPDSVKYAGLPTNWDWSDRNGINYDTEIRNQGSCGSCYAMATISSLESRFRVKSRLSFRPIISPQEIVSCSFYNQGCQGGYPFLVAKHAAEFGMLDAECMPYTARNSECSRTCKSERLHVKNYTYVGGYMGGCSEVAMMREIYENGPVMVAFQAPPDLFYYTGGIYTGPSPKQEEQGVNGVNVWQQTNHAVVAVGWGVDAKTGVKYWKLKNTWGLRWGENGYFRIRRGTNECGVESMATKADVLLPKDHVIPDDAPNPYAKETTEDNKNKHRFAIARKKRAWSRARSRSN